MAEVFPHSWFVIERLDDVIEWLQNMPINPEDKKAILHEWAAHAGVHLTGENVEAVTGHRAGVI